MALTQITFGRVGEVAASGGIVPAMIFDTVTVCTAITPGASTQSSAAAPSNLGGKPVCRIATDTAIHVTFGANPTATAANGLYIPAGGVEYVFVTAGHLAAVLAA